MKSVHVCYHSNVHLPIQSATKHRMEYHRVVYRCRIRATHASPRLNKQNPAKNDQTSALRASVFHTQRGLNWVQYLLPVGSALLQLLIAENFETSSPPHSNNRSIQTSNSNNRSTAHRMKDLGLTFPNKSNNMFQVDSNCSC